MYMTALSYRSRMCRAKGTDKGSYFKTRQRTFLFSQLHIANGGSLKTNNGQIFYPERHHLAITMLVLKVPTISNLCIRVELQWKPLLQAVYRC